MTSVGLLFVGAILLLNGLLFLGRVDAKGVAVFNLFAGALEVAIPLYLIATAATPDEILGAAGVFAFGFTYLAVGIVTLKGWSSDGIGWYSLWVALLAAGYAVVNVVRFDDALTGLLWAQWSVLWGVFFVVLGLGVERLTVAAGWLTVILSFTTATIPAFLQLLGAWPDVPVWVVAASIGATAVALVLLLARPERAIVTGPAGSVMSGS